MRLDDIRRRIPVEDRAAYGAAYAEAELAGRLGDAVHRLRAAAGLTEAELAARIGAEEEEVVRAEEGDPGVPLGYFVRLARALGVRATLSIGSETVPLEAPSPGV